MPPKRKKARKDTDVVRTAPDRKGKATGKDDENDFSSEDEDEDHSARYFGGMTTKTEAFVPVWRKRGRIKVRQVKFPRFFELPAEVRNMIYRYLVLSKSNARIDLSKSGSRYFQKGGLETALLFVNKQVSAEAMNILYDENRFTVRFVLHGWAKGFDFRIDPQVTHGKRLRSGTLVTPVPHTGLIHKKMLLKIRDLEIHLHMASHTSMCVHMRVMSNRFNERAGRECFDLFKDFVARGLVDQSQNKFYGLGDKSRWVLKISNGGGMSVKRLAKCFQPLVQRRQECEGIPSWAALEQPAIEAVKDTTNLHYGSAMILFKDVPTATTIEAFPDTAVKPIFTSPVQKMMDQDNLKIVLTGQWPKHYTRAFRWAQSHKNFDKSAVQKATPAVASAEDSSSDDDDDNLFFMPDNEMDAYYIQLQYTHGLSDYDWL